MRILLAFQRKVVSLTDKTFLTKQKGVRIMANKRQLKRSINGVSNNLLTMCMVSALFNCKPEHQDVEGIIFSILINRNDFLSRVSHPEPGMATKVYYKTLIADFNKQVSEIIDQISSLG